MPFSGAPSVVGRLGQALALGGKAVLGIERTIVCGLLQQGRHVQNESHPPAAEDRRAGDARLDASALDWRAREGPARAPGPLQDGSHCRYSVCFWDSLAEKFYGR